MNIICKREDNIVTVQDNDKLLNNTAHAHLNKISWVGISQYQSDIFKNQQVHQPTTGSKRDLNLVENYGLHCRLLPPQQ